MLKFNWNIDSYIYTQFFSSKDDFPQQKPSGSATVMIPKIESSTTKLSHIPMAEPCIQPQNDFKVNPI